MANIIPDEILSVTPEIALFASTLVSNVCIYILQMNAEYIQKYKEYSVSKFYSQYGHITILNYLNKYGAIFYESLDEIKFSESKVLIDAVYAFLYERGIFYLGSYFYEVCVKVVLMDIYASHNNVGFKDNSFDVIRILACEAFRNGLLKENYDYKRYICASVLNVIYQKLGYNFKDYLENKDEKCDFALSAFTIDLISQMKEALWDNLEERTKIKTMKYLAFCEAYGPCNKYIEPREEVNEIYLLIMPGMYITIYNFQNNSYKATNLIDNLTKFA